MLAAQASGKIGGVFGRKSQLIDARVLVGTDPDGQHVEHGPDVDRTGYGLHVASQNLYRSSHPGAVAVFGNDRYGKRIV